MHDLLSNNTTDIPTVLAKREEESLEWVNLEEVLAAGKVDVGSWWIQFETSLLMIQIVLCTRCI